jgi:hypothetical protein
VFCCSYIWTETAVLGRTHQSAFPSSSTSVPYRPWRSPADDGRDFLRAAGKRKQPTIIIGSLIGCFPVLAMISSWHFPAIFSVLFFFSRPLRRRPHCGLPPHILTYGRTPGQAINTRITPKLLATLYSVLLLYLLGRPLGSQLYLSISWWLRYS